MTVSYTHLDVYKRQVHTQQLPCRLPTVFKRQFKHDAVIDRQAQPGIVQHFLFELPSVPVCVAERDERIIRPLATGNRRQDISRGCLLYTSRCV